VSSSENSYKDYSHLLTVCFISNQLKQDIPLAGKEASPIKNKRQTNTQNIKQPNKSSMGRIEQRKEDRRMPENCPKCHLALQKWALRTGYRILNKLYCCVGCGDGSGCICII
jgi:hypothetical protein